ncbi:DUF6361 family protein [Tahibacter harae]|uniref:DUF6361 family protein n=1 Tax=Tahibacter harae TaxID=2963937 RepID=A0ABT1QT96_9GAMM|nr:DUF6361 family protein [Tahibacter harae]MCQ4165511.1 DUF6361 family protein [Tahibacter harae]
MGGIGWIDFSSDDRRRALDVLALAKEPGTLDELGIGQLRDAYAEALFPGFSTIQTRARYFLALPKILCDWREQPPAQRRRLRLEDYLAREENRLAEQLTKNHKDRNLSLEGIIGHTLAGRGGVKRPPSNAYWAGLRVFGLVRTTKSLGEFLRTWGDDAGPLTAVQSDDDDDDAAVSINHGVRRPPDSRGEWSGDLTLALSPPEARFLAERLAHPVPAGMASAGAPAHDRKDTVVAQLLGKGLATQEQALDPALDSFAAFSVWARGQTALSEACLQTIAAAARFSLAIEGAHILFNQAIAGRGGNGKHDALRAACEQDFPRWREQALGEGVFYPEAQQQWLQAVAVRSMKPKSCEFLERWNQALCAGHSVESLIRLVVDQAKSNKGNRSLLMQRQLSPLPWYGMRALEYRWPVARRMLLDIEKAG